MDRFPNLPNAPITEALIDIQVALLAGKGVADLESIAQRVSEKYPKKVMDIHSSNVQVRFGSEPSTDLTHERLGFGYSTEDGKNIFQARLNGFTFSRLKPYENWNILKSEATRLWNIYRDIGEPQEVTRIAVRFINHLRLPTPIRDFSDFLTAGPRLPPRLPQELVGFLTRNIILDKLTGSFAIVTQSFDPQQNPGPDSISVLLDIDAFYDESLDPGADDKLELRLEQLHMVKNRIFFESITEKMEELCR